MHRILIDSDVVLDLFMAREPHHSIALRFFSYLDLNSDTVIGYASPIAIANVIYILTKAQSQTYAIKKIRALRQMLRIVPIDEAVVSTAIQVPGKDFEDTLQYHCAVASELTAIVTRNVKDYPRDVISILTPQEFLAMDFMEKST